jgi:erythronate-4-phosphate dehydrogenase
MKIVADENIPLLHELFGGLGDIVTRPGRAISPADVRDAEVLLVRSVTPVGPALLAGSQVRFVGTATIGTDHLDSAWLAAAGIGVRAAPGCNALAVAEYVVAALLELQAALPSGGLLGVVGLGNVGTQVARLAAALGWRVVGHDPFVERPGLAQLPLPTLLAEADVVCLHTPLTQGGPHPTRHLIDAAALARLKPDAVLLNAGRGAVVDNQALRHHLAHTTRRVVLDVWEPEPALDPALLAQVAYGSPHIAGYSQEGKWRGSQQVYEGLCRHLGCKPVLHYSAFAGGDVGPVLTLPGSDDAAATVRAAVRQAYDIRLDDTALRRAQDEADPAAAFDRLRKHYRPRREFPAHRIRLPAADPAAPVLAGLGFRLES